jgi:hypothetical protein
MAGPLVGSSDSGWAVWGGTHNGTGCVGTAGAGTGTYGESNSGIGVHGVSSGNGFAAYFDGYVVIHGDLDVQAGRKSFKIDHPLDPKNRYLVHNSVESSEMKNVYDGVAQLDEDGTVSVDLPEWFEALNGDFRYQLTAVGGAAPNLHVAEEVSQNRFRIAGGEGGMKVCWQVTGARKDPWAAANPFEVEQEKPQEERGRYLQPDLYDAPKEQRVTIGLPVEDEGLRQMMSHEPSQPPQIPQPTGFAAPGFVNRLEDEHRQQIDELKREIEGLKQRR